RRTARRDSRTGFAHRRRFLCSGGTGGGRSDLPARILDSSPCGRGRSGRRRRRGSAFCYVLADGTRLAGTSSWGWRRCGAGLVDYCGESAGSPPGLRAARVTSEAIESRHCHTELGGVEDGQMGKIVLPGATKDALKAAPELQYAAAPSPSVAA